MGKNHPDDPSYDGDGAQSGFITHLIELRDRLLRIVIAITVVFAVLFPFANKLYAFLAGPLMKHMPEGSSMIAIDVASPFLTPFKLVLMLSVVLVIPFILHQIWAFVAPGLYKHEKRLAKPLLISSILLFYVGMAFAYYIVFPLIFGFFTSVAPEGVSVSTDINRYLDFVLMLFLAFGIAFEVPIATILILATGVTTAEKLEKMRPYIIVAAFVVGMFLTPPDVVSQILLAIPIWMLFEAGLWISKLLLKPVDKAEEVTETSPPSAVPAAAASSMERSVNEAIAEETPYEALTDEEMEAELDQIEAGESKDESEPQQEDDDSGEDQESKPKD